MKDLVISGELLQSAHITAKELVLEIAAYLYAQKRLTMGKARKLASLDQISFQKELAKRNVYIHYDIEDLHKDIQNLDALL